MLKLREKDLKALPEIVMDGYDKKGVGGREGERGQVQRHR